MVTLGGKEFALAPRYASFDGYNVHANVFLAAHDRSGLERLCRYILRPALAVGRIERLPDGRVRIGMKRVWSDGATAMEAPSGGGAGGGRVVAWGGGPQGAELGRGGAGGAGGAAPGQA